MKFVSFNSNTTSVTNGAGTANATGSPEFTTGFCEIYVAQSSVLYVYFYVYVY